MRKGVFFTLFLALSLLVHSKEALGQRRVVRSQYPVRRVQNYSYYRYYRVAVAYQTSVLPNLRTVFKRPLVSCQFAPFTGPVYVQNSVPQRQQVYEEVVREEFRTWPSQADEAEFGGSRLDALENEIAELRSEVAQLSKKIEMSLANVAKPQESQVETEKIEKLKKELRELKSLLEQFKREK